MDDFAKLEIARNGDRRAWSFLYIKYYDRVLEVAEDVVERNQVDLQPEDLLQRYWIDTIQSGAVIFKNGHVRFEDWLSNDFEQWWKHNRPSEADEVLLEQPRYQSSGSL